jgi:hypothetical protein
MIATGSQGMAETNPDGDKERRAKARNKGHHMPNGLTNTELAEVALDWRRIAALYRCGEGVGVTDPMSSAERLEPLAAQIEAMLLAYRIEVKNRTIKLERNEE